MQGAKQGMQVMHALTLTHAVYQLDHFSCGRVPSCNRWRTQEWFGPGRYVVRDSFVRCVLRERGLRGVDAGA